MWALWQTAVPDDLVLPDVRLAAFGADDVRRAEAHARFMRVVLVLALGAQLAALVALARAAPAIDRRLPGPRAVRALALALVAAAAAWLVRLPFGAAAHWRGRRDGVATRGWAEWLWHRLPGATGIAVLVGSVALVLVLHRLAGRRWWVVAAPAGVALVAAGVFLQPLALPDRRPPAAVADDVRALARRAGVPVPDVAVERASRRTTRANAEVFGVGPTTRIVFWDTLVDGRFTPAEVRAVAAHEVAHLELAHVWKGLAWVALFAFPAAFALGWVVERGGGLGRPAGVPALLVGAAVVQLLALPLVSAVTRRYEAEADWRALEATRDPAAAAAAYRRFVATNLADPDPPRWAYVVFADHPTLRQRVAMAEAWELRRRATRREAAPPGGS